MRIKDIGRINARTLAESTPGKYTFRYIDISSVSSEGEILLSEEMTFDMSPSRARRIVSKGDVIISTVGTYLRAIAGIGWDTENVIASTGFAVISPGNSFDNDYVRYLLMSDAIVQEICKDSCGVSYPAITASKLSAIRIPECDLGRQKKIVKYLNERIDLINKRICLRERELQLLNELKRSEIDSVVTRGLDPDVPMKDSGIDWIGPIPAHWIILRIKDICTYVTRGCTPLYVDQESDFIVMNQATFSKGYIDYSNIRYSSFCKSFSHIEKEDLLIASTGGGVLGKVLLFEEECDKFFADTHVTILRNSAKKNITKFLYYYFSTKYQMINALMAQGSTNQTELQKDKLLQHAMPVPPDEEMYAICLHLDARILQMNHMIDNINTQIEKLKLLKKALINEVITGRRPVQ